MLTYQFAPELQMPSDAQRVNRIRSLIEHGFKDRALMSHDIHTRNRLVSSTENFQRIRKFAVTLDKNGYCR